MKPRDKSSSLPSQKLAYVSVIAILLRLCSAFLAFLVQLCLAKWLGAAEYGKYAVVLAWLQTVAGFADMGFPTTSLRYIPKYFSEGEIPLIVGFMHRTVRISIVLGLLGMAGICMVAWLFNGTIEDDLVKCVYVGSILVPILTLTRLNSTFLLSLQRTFQGMMDPLTTWIVMLSVLIFSAYFVPFSLTAVTVICIQGLAALGTLIVMHVLIVIVCRTYRLQGSRQYRTREWVGESIPYMFLIGADSLRESVPIILCGMLLHQEQIGTFAIVWRIVTVVILGLQAVNSVVAPRFSAIYSTGTRSELQAIVQFSAGIATAFAVIACGAILVLGGPLLDFLGDGYSSGYPLLVIVMIGPLISAATGSVSYLLKMTGNQRLLLRLSLLSVVASIMVNYTLIYNFGVTGAAIGVTLAVGLWNSLLVCVVWRRLRIWSFVGYWQK